MAEIDLVVRAARVVGPSGERAADVAVRDGRVIDVAPYASVSAARQVVALADDEVLLPGLVDSHVHVNEPGRTEWEGFASATRAAAAGGVTTLVDMPLNSVPPTLDRAALAAKRVAAVPQLHVDAAFWGGAVPGNADDLRGLWDDGVLGFKCFLLDSGVPEFPAVTEADLDRVMRAIAAFDGLLLVHAEDDEVIARASVPPPGRGYDTFVASRPADAEERAVATVLAAAARTGCRVHVVHVSSAGSLPAIAEARRAGVRVSVETCPHYLTLSAEQVPDGATAYKCCPPLRDAANADGLWAGLRSGAIDLVVTDHSPSTTDLKCLDSGDFGQAWGGIASLELGLSVTWTGASARGFALTDVVRWMCLGPATMTGLSRKGRIAPGADADFCVFAPEEEYVVDAGALRQRHALTPYDGLRLRGVVRSTWLAGRQIGRDDEPRGRLLRRADS